MITATVTVRSPKQTLTFPAIGRTTGAIAASAMRLFEVCSVAVIPLKKDQPCR